MNDIRVSYISEGRERARTLVEAGRGQSLRIKMAAAKILMETPYMAIGDSLIVRKNPQPADKNGIATDAPDAVVVLEGS